jgi:hypothetical protein
MIKAVLVASLLAASASLAFAATDEELRTLIVGAWGQDPTCQSGSLTFNADGTFALARGEDSDTGTWQITGGMLSGATSDGNSRPDVKLTIEGDSLIFGEMDETLTRCAP